MSCKNLRFLFENINLFANVAYRSSLILVQIESSRLTIYLSRYIAIYSDIRLECHQRGSVVFEIEFKSCLFRSFTSFPFDCPIRLALTIQAVEQRTRPYCSRAMVKEASALPKSGQRLMLTIWINLKPTRVSKSHLMLRMTMYRIQSGEWSN